MARSRGSSPLARGLPPTHPQFPPPARIIPARAGFTGSSRTGATRHGDHPRSRGVYVNQPTMVRSIPGSSPLARGLPRPRHRPGAEDRIIPARAGFTPRPASRRSRSGDHPRSRGVYPMRIPRKWISPGSSPLARGLPERVPGLVEVPGIIPARAGFTAEGSSETRLIRIIPARAGFTANCGGMPAVVSDHPRSRGVYYWCIWAVQVPSGSSPLARGLRDVDLVADLSTGIIPARAGFTTTATSPPPRRPDHPRSRGVYGLLLRGSV